MLKLISFFLVAFVCYQQTTAGPTGTRKFETAPYHVHMLIYDEHMAEWPASGVLVSRRHVLTAAVNVHNYNRWDLGFGSETARNLYVIKSFNAYVHEQFNDTTNDNNIALIVMPEPVRTSVRIAPIALPLQHELIPREGDIGHIAGYMWTSAVGKLSPRLNHGAQRIISEGDCKAVYPHAKEFINHFFCGNDDHFNACGGIQGSGLIVKQKDESVLAGIVSFGSIWRDCDRHTPLGFIRVAEYVDWIQQKTNGTASAAHQSSNENINMIGYVV